MSKISVTKAGQTVLADVMTKAVQKAALEGDVDQDLIIICLIALLIGGRYMDRDLYEPILKHGGVLETCEITDLALQVIARHAVVTAPHRRTSTSKNDQSYQIGELIGRILGADDYIDRVDTTAVLEHFNGNELWKIAIDQRLVSDPMSDEAKPAKYSTSQLREAMIGKMPNWRPTSFATFTEDLS